MVANPNDVAVRRAHKCFVVPETTKGTLAVPSAGDYIIPVGIATLKQNPSFTNSEEIQNTRDVMDRFQDRMPAGAWSIPVYCRPSGSAGTAPMEDELLEALFGTETIVGGTSVTYTQAIEKPSVSIWLQVDHTVFFASGATVSALKLALAGKGALKLDFSGKFMEMGHVGTQDIASAISLTDTTWTVDDASCYSVGGLVEMYDVSGDTVYDNSGSGYAITAVDTAANTITVGTGAENAMDIDDIIRPFLPTGTEVGDPIENRKGVAKIDAVSTNVRKFDINIDDPCVYLEDEITTGDYPTDYVEDDRKINGSLGLAFRKNDSKFFKDNVTGASPALSIVIGNTAGSIVTINMPNCSLDVPEWSDSKPTININMPFVSLGNTTGEDSMSMAFT